MQVFKTFLRVLKKNTFVALIYLFAFVLVFISFGNENSSSNSYNDIELRIMLIDEDNSAASDALKSYIERSNEIAAPETDKDAILSLLYYQDIDYVLTIKEGYEEKLASGITDGLFENYQVNGNYSGALFESTLDEYVKNVCACTKAGMALLDALEAASDALSEEITVTMVNFDEENDTGLSIKLVGYFQFLPYILVSIFMSTACPVLMTMNRRDLRRRTDSSCLPQSRYSMQILLGCTLLFIVTWAIIILISLIMCAEMNQMVLLAIFNSFVFMLTAAGIAILASALLKERNAITFATNIIGLGMSFLCGVFVPMDLLNDGVLAISRFLPAYWYVYANNMIAGACGEVFEMESYLTCIGIQFGFALVLFLGYFIVERMHYKDGKM